MGADKYFYGALVVPPCPDDQATVGRNGGRSPLRTAEGVPCHRPQCARNHAKPGPWRAPLGGRWTHGHLSAAVAGAWTEIEYVVS